MDINNPRDVFRIAAKHGLIEDPVIWFEFIRKRNLTTQMYDQEIVEDIYEDLSKFKEELTKVIDKIMKL